MRGKGGRYEARKKRRKKDGRLGMIKDKEEKGKEEKEGKSVYIQSGKKEGRQEG